LPEVETETDSAPLPGAPGSFRRRLAEFRQRHERAEHVLFFIAGFTFDAMMVRRIDEPKVLIQQAVYLTVAGLLLFGLNAWDHRKVKPPRFFRGVWRWSQPALHFVLGTLLNAYALFYFKSGSGLSALFFLVTICVLLLMNELPQFRRFGPVVIFGLYSFCLTSYFAYLYPVLFGRLEPWMFLAAVGTSLFPLLLLAWGHHRFTGDQHKVFIEALAPSIGVQTLLVVLFLFHLVPPVPLSLRDIGIYHGVVRSPTDATYALSHHPLPWWRFWSKDEQEFLARPGDRIFCFVHIFAPRNFHDEVRMRWAHRDSGAGWASSDAVPIKITGGKEDGYAGYSYKQNWSAGDWLVTVETRDGREIGRRRFTVSADPDAAAEDHGLVTTQQ
jgi:Protein of unknown function (DUF2914)